MTDARRRSPLADRRPASAPDDALRLEEVRFLGKLALQGDGDAIADAIRTATGLELPRQAGGSNRNDTTTVCWLGPEEWLLLCPPESEAGLAKSLRDALGDTPHQLVDVTDQHTVIELAGPGTRDLLSRLTTLDLHPRHFRAGQVAGSLFGQVQAVLLQVSADDADGGPAFRLVVRWSHATYMYDLLLEAGRAVELVEQAG